MMMGGLLCDEWTFNHVFLSVYRHTLVSSVWSSIPTKTCPSTPRTSLRCTGARRGTKCPLTSTPSQSLRTDACYKVSVALPQNALTCQCMDFNLFLLKASLFKPEHLHHLSKVTPTQLVILYVKRGILWLSLLPSDFNATWNVSANIQGCALFALY